MIWNWLRRHPYLADTVIVLGLGVAYIGNELHQSRYGIELLLAVAGTPEPLNEGALERLTEREREILRLLAGGLSNAELAEKLFLSETTVKTHVSAVLRKLGVRDCVQAVIAAYDAGLVRPGAA